jgi:hypothetical protein
MENIGKGTALDVDAKISFEPSAVIAEKIWKERVFVPRSFRDFLLMEHGQLERVGKDEMKGMLILIHNDEVI